MIYKIYYLRGSRNGKVVDEVHFKERKNEFSSVEEAYAYMQTTKDFERMEFTILPYIKSDAKRNIQ